MPTVAMLIILSGVTFLFLNIYLFLDNYKKLVTGYTNKKNVYINILVIVSSMILIALGIVYLIIMNQQL